MSYHLFEVTGIELEYMLVDRNTFGVKPVVDELFLDKTGEVCSDVDNGKIEWSNELVAHVIELKTNGPTRDLENLDELFHQNILEINEHLKLKNTRLLPGAAHPLMNPETDTQLWKHSNNEVYELYHIIFDCRGHGWSNLQSTHINLPFSGDEEFEKLHAAIRLLLPIIPGLSASSPFLDGKFTGFKDARLNYYKTNQKEIPEMTGTVIPEQVFSRKDYFERIFEPINKAIKPYDTENILEHHFLNSRGAIARFDRQAIEIRIIDIQECPKADVAIAVLIIETLKLLVGEEWIALEDQKSFDEKQLFAIFNEVIVSAEETMVKDSHFLSIFDITSEASVKVIWLKIYERVKENISPKHQESLEFLLNNGSLATRILQRTGRTPSSEQLKKVYLELADCLVENKFFKP
ncbi:carboxylate-amine ligase [Salegentibacter sp. HM20]